MEVITQKDSYKLILKGQRYVEYDDFKYFIPNFTKEFNLKILRFNSTGYINGILFAKKDYKLLNVSPTQLKYYLTDYKTTFQLEYLLKGYGIPYFKVPAISIEAYNIPLSKPLNRYFYFKKLTLPNNPLQYILYSFYAVLDKKAVDKYVKKHYPNSKNYIKAYLTHLHSKPKKKAAPKPAKKTVKKPPKKKENKPKFRLILTRVHTMMDYGYEYTPFVIDKNPLIDKSYKIVSFLEKTKNKLNEIADKTVIFKPKQQFEPIAEDIQKAQKDIEKLQESIKTPKCIFNPNEIDKECFKNPKYFHNYIYFAIKKSKIPQDEEIIAYGDYKTFNDIGKYYYEHGFINKSEIYLNKAYVLAKDKTIPAHNLSVLYASYNTLHDIDKAIKFLKESNLTIDLYNLGVYYYMGRGVKESDKKAREYFLQAQDIPYAKENLKIMDKYKIGIK
ncbi:MAG: hypothetical protein GXO62_06620 [Epsilonproteobacteria bacterium]|nr:hypothetical protein [Campylobacterota bacterium]